MRVGALCAGYGGLELGLSLAGLDVELTYYAEIDKHAAQVMGHHHPDVPNLGDLTEITDPPRVDVVTAGFPCQPVSTAGKRKGVNDERWLIEDVCRVAREAGADWLILENVAGLRSANGGDAMARVVSALAGNGFGAEWTSVRASDVGAPHGRLRWFCLAHAEGAERGVTEHELLGATVGPAAESGKCHRSPAEHAGDHVLQFGPYADAIARWEPIVGRPAPDPTDDKRRLNPRFVEWMMGLPDGWVTDAGVTRSQALKILGNGVVPQQAALALRLLSEQAVAA